jgi:hypothetical protein
MGGYIKNSIAALLLLYSCSVAGQHGFKVRHYYYVVADTVNARAEPGFDGEVLRSFRKGDSLMVLKVGAMAAIKGKKAPWCDIGYTIGNSERRGVVWGGYLSRKRPRK